MFAALPSPRLRSQGPFGLHLHSPKMIFELPAGGRHMVQHVEGYDMKICSGVPILKTAEETGARPGKLVRSTA